MQQNLRPVEETVVKLRCKNCRASILCAERAMIRTTRIGGLDQVIGARCWCDGELGILTVVPDPS